MGFDRAIGDAKQHKYNTREGLLSRLTYRPTWERLSTLNGGEQRLALGDQQTEVLQPFRPLLERSGLLGRPGAAVVSSDLEQDADAHDEPPMAEPMTGHEFSTIAGVRGSRGASTAPPRSLWLFQPSDAVSSQAERISIAGA